MVTEEEWGGEIARTDRLRWLSLFGGLLAVGLMFVPCIMVGEALATGWRADLLSAGLLVALLLPMSSALIVLGARQQHRADEKFRNLNADLTNAIADADRLNAELSEAIGEADRQAEIRDSQVQRQRFESRL